MLHTEKIFRGRDSGNSPENCVRSMEMNYTTVQNGTAGIVIDGTTYTHATNGIGATGYINPDVVPTLQSPSAEASNGRGLSGTVKRVKNKVTVQEESMEVEQNRQNGQAVAELRPENNVIGGEGGKHRYQNFPPPLSSMGTSTSLSRDSGALQPEDVYSGSSLYSQRTNLVRHSFSPNPSPRFDHRVSQPFPQSKDHTDTRLNGAINGSFAEEDMSVPIFHRDHQFQPNVFLSSPNGFRTLRSNHQSLDSAPYAGRYFSPQLSTNHHGTLPRNFTHSSMPPTMAHSSMSPSMSHSTPMRPEWEASPVRLPDWGRVEPPVYPQDYGLPVGRGRPEVHLAHNPLDTLQEEEDFPGAQYSSGAIQALEMLNQVCLPV